MAEAIKLAAKLVAVALLALALRWGFLLTVMLLGVGPWGRGFALLTSGAMNTYSAHASTAWFEAAAQAVAYDRFIVWPVALCVASFAYVRFVTPKAWWHGLVIAAAPLSDALGTEYPRSVLPFCLGYAVLTVALCVLLGRIGPSPAGRSAAT